MPLSYSFIARSPPFIKSHKKASMKQFRIFALFLMCLSVYFYGSFVIFEWYLAYATPSSNLINAKAPLKELNHRTISSHEARGYGGMVTADNQLASEVGAQVLREGGDAVDAAVATALMLGVLQPYASGIGGGGFAVIYRPGEPAYTLDFREIAPALAHEKLYQDQAGNVIAKASTIGALAAGIPGEIAGLYELHKRHGKLPWSRLVQPALQAARDGFKMHPALYKKVKSSEKWLKNHPQLGSALLNQDGQAKALGELVRFPQLAWTLAEVSQKGASGFYQGAVAQEMAHAVKQGGGIMTTQDLANYQPKERAPIQGNYGSYQLITMPPPSSGGAVILQVLKALEGAQISPALQNPDQLHQLTEALKHAFADRANLMGDPDFVTVPIKDMLKDQRIEEIKKLFNPSQTLPHEHYGGQYAPTKDGGTSHFNVIDQNGAAVALTTTINTSFGSRFVAGKSGVLLNNEMDDFVSKPGIPNAFGLVGREANAIAAGKKPLSSMSPTIILEGNRVRAMVGASGGPTIITGTLQVILNLIHTHAQHGDVAAAVIAPRIHHQWTPDSILYDQGFKSETLDALKARGHTLQSWNRFTSVQALWIYDPEKPGADPLMVGASDPSKLGKPCAVR